MASLVADYGESSGTDSGSEDSESEKVTKKSPKTSSQKLPLPKFGEEGILRNSVFANPFVEAENAKSAILEKHVKMIPTQDNITQINGKQICWMYRKGRCRFGHNCKYAHDSDLYNTSSVETSESVDNSVICDTLNNIVNNSVNVESEDCDNQKKKKRPGLSETLVPGKKYMNMYKKQKLNDSNTKTVKKV